MDGQRDQNQTQPPENANPKQEKRSPYQHVENHLKRRIFAGFLVLVPLLVTVLVIQFFVSFVDGFLEPHVEDTVLDFWGVGVVFGIVLLYLVGMLVSASAGRRAIEWQNAVLSRIPIVKSIYSVAHQAADAITSPMGHEERRVVFVEWPREGYMAIGFVTGHCHALKDGVMQPLAVVYIPTVPNPTSGNLTFIPEDELIETNMTMEDAMKLVFSGGTVLPDDMRLNNRSNNRGNVPELPPYNGQQNDS